jgi:hypothetical protein
MHIQPDPFAGNFTGDRTAEVRRGEVTLQQLLDFIQYACGRPHCGSVNIFLSDSIFRVKQKHAYVDECIKICFISIRHDIFFMF